MFLMRLRWDKCCSALAFFMSEYWMNPSDARECAWIKQCQWDVSRFWKSFEQEQKKQLVSFDVDLRQYSCTCRGKSFSNWCIVRTTGQVKSLPTLLLINSLLHASTHINFCWFVHTDSIMKTSAMNFNYIRHRHDFDRHWYSDAALYWPPLMNNLRINDNFGHKRCQSKWDFDQIMTHQNVLFDTDY